MSTYGHGARQMHRGPAPWHSCVSCFKGDTETAIVSHGEAEFHIVTLHKTTGMTLEEADATFKHFCRDAYGTDPGYVKSGAFLASFRLCAECAAKTNAPLTLIKDIKDGTEVNGYIQNPDTYLPETKRGLES